jgi:hypothetical protein
MMPCSDSVTLNAEFSLDITTAGSEVRRVLGTNLTVRRDP